MTDGVTPRCVFCGDPMKLAAHMARLDAGQSIIDLMHDAMPGATFRANTKCGACRADPERAYRMMAGVSVDELRARMRGT